MPRTVVISRSHRHDTQVDARSLLRTASSECSARRTVQLGCHDELYARRTKISLSFRVQNFTSCPRCAKKASPRNIVQVKCKAQQSQIGALRGAPSIDKHIPQLALESPRTASCRYLCRMLIRLVVTRTRHAFHLLLHFDGDNFVQEECQRQRLLARSKSAHLSSPVRPVRLIFLPCACIRPPKPFDVRNPNVCSGSDAIASLAPDGGTVLGASYRRKTAQL